VTPAAIRTAEPAEIDEIVCAYEWLFAAPGVRPPHWDPERAADRLRRAISSPTSTVLVAGADGPLIGFCTAYADIESVRFGQRVWVEDLAVHREHRSLGIGKQLLDEAKQWAHGRGATRLQLDSAQTRTDAHRFYDRESPDLRSVSFGWWL
jgi:GNAT superfamily N-acetyltransferase